MRAGSVRDRPHAERELGDVRARDGRGGQREEGRREAGIRALPTSLEEAVRAFETDDVLAKAFGDELAATVVDVRRGEIAALEGRSPEDVAAALRWVH